ncbi:glycosyltransferase [Lentzea flaviverrucosa]|nr:glycosyltransferase [Lentzea flaviverrucosa]
MDPHGMQSLQNKAADLGSRLSGIAGGMRGLTFSGNALGPIGVFAVPGLNTSTDSAVAQAERGSTAFGNVQSGIKATVQTTVGADQHNKASFKSIESPGAPKPPPGGSGAGASKSSSPSGPKASAPGSIAGGGGPAGAGVKTPVGPPVAKTPDIKSGSGSAGRGVNTPSGPAAAPVPNLRSGGPASGGVKALGGQAAGQPPNLKRGNGSAGGVKAPGGQVAGQVPNFRGGTPGSVNTPAGRQGTSGGGKAVQIPKAPNGSGATPAGKPGSVPIGTPPVSGGVPSISGKGATGTPGKGVSGAPPAAGGVSGTPGKGTTGGPAVPGNTPATPGAKSAEAAPGSRSAVAPPSAGGGPRGVSAATHNPSVATAAAPPAAPGAAPAAGSPGGSERGGNRFGASGGNKGVFEAPKPPGPNGSMTKAPPAPAPGATPGTTPDGTSAKTPVTSSTTPGSQNAVTTPPHGTARGANPMPGTPAPGSNAGAAPPPMAPPNANPAAGGQERSGSRYGGPGANKGVFDAPRPVAPDKTISKAPPASASSPPPAPEPTRPRPVTDAPPAARTRPAPARPHVPGVRPPNPDTPPSARAHPSHPDGQGRPDPAVLPRTHTAAQRFQARSRSKPDGKRASVKKFFSVDFPGLFKHRPEQPAPKPNTIPAAPPTVTDSWAELLHQGTNLSTMDTVDLQIHVNRAVAEGKPVKARLLIRRLQGSDRQAELQRHYDAAVSTKGDGGKVEVPKALHFAWFGGTPSDAAVQNMLEWAAKIADSNGKSADPDLNWNATLWTDGSSANWNQDVKQRLEDAGISIRADVDSLVNDLSTDVQNRTGDATTINDVYSAAKDPDAKAYNLQSDIARYAVLARTGGVYVDVDVRPGSVSLDDVGEMTMHPSDMPLLAPRLRDQQSVDSALTRVGNVAPGAEVGVAAEIQYGKGEFGNSFIVAPPDNDFIKTLTDVIPKKFDSLRSHGLPETVFRAQLKKQAPDITGPNVLVDGGLNTQNGVISEFVMDPNGLGLQVELSYLSQPVSLLEKSDYSALFDPGLKDSWAGLQWVSPESEAQLDDSTKASESGINVEVRPSVPAVVLSPPPLVAPPAAPPLPPPRRHEAPEVKSGGAPPPLTPPTPESHEGKDVLTDQSWRYEPAVTAEWFAPDTPASPDTWADRREQAESRTVDLVVPDITTGSTPSNLENFDGIVRYDLRRIETSPGRFVQEYTVKVSLDASPSVDPDLVEQVSAKAISGVDSLLNQGFRLPSGDQFHLNLEFTPFWHAHTTIRIDDDHPINQSVWNTTSSPQELAHEVLHYLGAPDEYRDGRRVFQQHSTSTGVHLDDGSMMGRDVLYPERNPGLRPRHLWLVENTAKSQVMVPDTLLDAPRPPEDGSLDTPGSRSRDSGSTGDPGAQDPPTARTRPSPTSRTPDPDTGISPRSGEGTTPPRPAAPAVPPPSPILMTTVAPQPVGEIPGTALPGYFTSNQALGAITPTAVGGADAVVAELHGIRPGDATRIKEALENDFETFLGTGRNFQVKVGRTWHEANIRAEMHADTAQPGTHSPDTKVERNFQATASSTTTNTVATSNDVGGSVMFGPTTGPYATVGGKSQFATPAVSQATTTSIAEQRAIKSGEGAKTVTVPVAYEITLTDANGEPVRFATLATGPDVTLVIPDALTAITTSGNTSGTVTPPDADWGVQVETAVPEAVVVDHPSAFDDIAAKLHPSITKIGSPGREALQTFLSPTSIRDNLPAMLGGHVTSPDLISPHASKGAAVQMTATLKDAKLIGTHDSSVLQLQDTLSGGSSIAATTKTGFDVTAGGGANIGVPGAVVGAVGGTISYSTRTAEGVNAGTAVTRRSGVQVKNETGLYEVTAEVEVRAPAGGSVKIPVTAHLRVGLHEAGAAGLPTPAGTRNTTTDPDTAGTKYPPPYLADSIAAGNAKVGEFVPATKVQEQVEQALRELPGFESFLPTWNDPDANPRSSKGKGYADFAEQLANQRKLTAALSPAALKATMDSLLGPGVQVQVRNTGRTTNTYANVTVRAKVSNPEHLGKADARPVDDQTTAAPKLDAGTSTTKGWTGAVQGRVAIPVKTGVAALIPLPQASASYGTSWTEKTTAGPTVTTTSANPGSADSQVFSHDVEFEVEISTFTRPRAWVRKIVPGAPGFHAPQPQVVASTGNGLDRIDGKVNLWVSDSSALDHDPGDGFKPGDPEAEPLENPPTVRELLAPREARPKAPEFLHVETIANAAALRDQAIDALNRAAGGDSALTVPGTASRAQIDRMFAPENLKANLRTLVETGLQENEFKYDRRVTDRSGAVGVHLRLGKPTLVSISDTSGADHSVTGGYKAGESYSTSRTVDLTAGVTVPVRPNASPPTAGAPTAPSGSGGAGVAGKVTPWSDTRTESSEVGGSVDRGRSTPAEARTALVQFDANATIVGESRAGNVLHAGTPRAEGATVSLPRSVFVRVSEDVARDLGLLPTVRPTVPEPDFPAMAPPSTVTEGEPGALGLSDVESVPDLSGVVHDLAEQLRANTKKFGSDSLVPDSVLKDSMSNFQRIVDLSSSSTVTALIDSALDGGVPLLAHQPGTFTKDSYQVILRARTGTPRFDGVVNDGADLSQSRSGSRKDTAAIGRGTGWGAVVRAPGLAAPGGATPNVSGTTGVTAAVNVGGTAGTALTESTAEAFGHSLTASGPAARYTVPIEFELVVERGDSVVARAGSGEQDMTVRLHADNLKIVGAPAPQPYMSAAFARGSEQATPEAIARWQRSDDARTLPPTASVENLRGAEDLREAGVKALIRAGAEQGLTGKGTGALNSLLSTLSAENLHPHLPSMLTGPLAVPGLREAALTFGQKADLQVYAKLVNPRLDALSDGVKLDTKVRTKATESSSEAKVSDTTDLAAGLATGSAAVVQGGDPQNAARFGTTGIELRQANEDSPAVSGGLASTSTGAVKASEASRSGLVQFDVEYRAVATIGGRTGVVDLAVPGSAGVRLAAADAESLLGKTFSDELDTAHTELKEAADNWREAEKEVDTARHEAQDRINDAAAVLARTDRPHGDAQTALNAAVETHLGAKAALAGAEAAHRDARAEVASTRASIEELTPRIAELSTIALAAKNALGEAQFDSDAKADDQAALEKALTTAHESAVDDLTEQLQLARYEVTRAKTVLLQKRKEADDAYNALEDGQQRLAGAHAQLTGQREKAVTARKAVDTARQELTAAEKSRAGAQAEHDRLSALRDDQAKIVRDAETELDGARREADAKQRLWWDKKATADQTVADFNAAPKPPPAPEDGAEADTPGVVPPAPGTDHSPGTTTVRTAEQEQRENSARRELADRFTALGLDPAPAIATFDDLAVLGSVENHVADVMSSPAVRESVNRVVAATATASPELAARARSLMSDALVTTSAVPVRHRLVGDITKLKLGDVHDWRAARPLTPAKLEEVLASIADDVEAGRAPLPDLPHRATDPLARRMAVLGLVNLVPHARNDLLANQTFATLLGSPRLPDALFGGIGLDEQRFLNTCDSAAVNTGLRSTLPTIAAQVYAGRELADRVEEALGHAVTHEPDLLAERDKPGGRTVEQVVRDRIAEARSTFDLLEDRATGPSPDWAVMSDDWGRAMQKLSAVADPADGADSVPVLSRKVIRGAWAVSAAIAVPLGFDRPGRRANGVSPQYRNVAELVLADPTPTDRTAPIAHAVNDEFWSRVHRLGVLPVTLEGRFTEHAVTVQAVRHEGAQAYLVGDPKKKYFDLLGPDEFASWAAKNSASASLPARTVPDTNPVPPPPAAGSGGAARGDVEARHADEAPALPNGRDGAPRPEPKLVRNYRFTGDPVPFTANQPDSLVRDDGFPAFTTPSGHLTHTAPPLRTSGDGTLAINGTNSVGGAGAPVLQAREFFATTEVLERAQVALHRAKSNVALVIEGPDVVVTAEDGHRTVLHRVVPRFAGRTPDVCRDMAAEVAGGPFDSMVLRGPDGSPVLAPVDTTSGLEVSGTHHLAAHLADLAHGETDLTAAGPRSAAWVVKLDEEGGVDLPGRPRPGLRYGAALNHEQDNAGARRRMDELARRTGVNRYASARPGEAFMVSSISSERAGGGRELQVNVARGDTSAHPYGYHFAAVVARTPDGTVITLENYRREAKTARLLDEAVDSNLRHHGPHLESTAAALDSEIETATRDGDEAAVEVLRAKKDLATALMSLRDAGDNPSPDVRKAAVQSMASVLHLPRFGDQWYFRMYREAPGETFFDQWAMLYDTDVPTNLTNPLVTVAGGYHAAGPVRVWFDERSKEVSPDQRGGLRAIANQVARAALWRQDNGMPLPAVIATGYGLGGRGGAPRALATGEQRAANAAEIFRTELQAALGSLQGDDVTLRADDIGIELRSEKVTPAADGDNWNARRAEIRVEFEDHSLDADPDERTPTGTHQPGTTTHQPTQNFFSTAAPDFRSFSPPRQAAVSAPSEQPPASGGAETGHDASAQRRTVLDDEGWRHFPGKTADWMAPDARPLHRDQWEHLRSDAPGTFTQVETELTAIDTDSPLVTDAQGRVRPDLRAQTVPVRHDVRRIEVEPGRWVKEFTLKVHFDVQDGVEPDEVAELEWNTLRGVDRMYNQGYRMPDGDQFHVRVEFTDDPAQAYQHIRVWPEREQIFHDQWSAGLNPQDAAHELGHYGFALHDAYESSASFQDKPAGARHRGAGGSAVAEVSNRVVRDEDSGLMSRSWMPDTVLRPRELWQITRNLADTTKIVPETSYVPPDGDAPAPDESLFARAAIGDLDAISALAEQGHRHSLDELTRRAGEGDVLAHQELVDLGSDGELHALDGLARIGDDAEYEDLGDRTPVQALSELAHQPVANELAAEMLRSLSAGGHLGATAELARHGDSPARLLLRDLAEDGDPDALAVMVENADVPGLMMLSDEGNEAHSGLKHLAGQGNGNAILALAGDNDVHALVDAATGKGPAYDAVISFAQDGDPVALTKIAESGDVHTLTTLAAEGVRGAQDHLDALPGMFGNRAHDPSTERPVSGEPNRRDPYVDHVSATRRHLRHLALDVLNRPVPPPVTADGLYAAVSVVVRQAPAALRAQVLTSAATTVAVSQAAADFTTTRPVRTTHLTGALIESSNWRMHSDTIENTGAGNARDLAGHLIATHLGVNLVIHQGTGKPPLVLAPSGNRGTGSVEIDMVVLNGQVTYRPH